MRLFTPDNLLYPIKITQLLRSSGDEIARNDPLFAYEYKSKVHESTADNPEGDEVERTWPARFESELEGSLDSLHVAVGQLLTRRTHVADIEEPCLHEVQFGGMCANCGRDLTVLGSYNSTMRDTERATVNTVHGHTALLVSHHEATRADEEGKRRLLDARKLSLVVDLDQTIIHATVDPTVSEWQQDPSNPNHDAVKDVRAFQLIDEGPGARGCWYYIKLRPGLADFLSEISQYYELHIYTMGTRAYAENIAKIIDPGRRIFGDRILSRDESGSMTAKSLKRLFPVDSKMVVIIDDRGDVWQWSPNLIKVAVFDFFVGIGDINSSFLPKRPEIEANATKAAPVVDTSESEESLARAKESESNGNIAQLKITTGPPSGSEPNGEMSAVDRLVSMAGNQDAGSMKEKTDEQGSALATQLAERPLLQKQKILDAVENEAKASPAAEAAVAEFLAENGDGTESPSGPDYQPKYRHNLLQDDDTELIHLSNSLQAIHSAFFKAYDKTLPPPSLHMKQNLDIIPDAANIMRDLKSRVLSGVRLVFSGVVPLGVDINAYDTVIWARSFGATVTEDITKKTTHLVASPERRTAKVRQAARHGRRIKIVSVGWLMTCFSLWRRVDESPYSIHSDAEPKTEPEGGLPDNFGEDERGALSGSEEGDVTTGDEAGPTGTEDDGQNGIDGPARGGEDDDMQALARFAPAVQREDSSPTDTENVEDWGGIDAELAEFLGSDVDDESDTDSMRDGTGEQGGPPSSQGKKRKRKRGGEDGAQDTESESQDGEEDRAGSRLQKRKREALARTSSLTNVAAVPDGARPDERQTADPGGGDADDEDDEDNDDLEAALAAEMDKLESEEDEA